MANDEARRLLEIYLQDHRAGATAGLQLVRRCRTAHQDPGLDELLTWLEAQVADDVRSLERLMDGLGVEPSRVKELGGAVGELVGRAKLNGRLVKRSPLSDLLELEAMSAAILAKRALWRALANVGDLAIEDPSSFVGGLAERASEQLRRVEEAHDGLARRVLVAS